MESIDVQFKCGEIFYLKNEDYIFSCFNCKETFQDFITFRCHQNEHYKREENRLNELNAAEDIKDESGNSNNSSDVKPYNKVLIEKYEVESSNDSENEYWEVTLNDNTNENEIFLSENDSLNIEDNQSLENITLKIGDIFNKKSTQGSPIRRRKSSSTFYDTQETDKNPQNTVFCSNFNCSYPNKHHKEKECIELQKLLENHENNSETLENGIFVCEYCARHFQTLEKLENHQKFHTQHIEEKHLDKILHLNADKKGEKVSKLPLAGRYVCNICDQIFKYHAHFIKHEQIHLNNRLRCKICMKTFRNMKGLKLHEATHSSEKPYKCTQCSATFALKRNLNTHFIYKHTESKPYSCQYEGGCGKTFKTDHLRKIHEKRHDQNPKYQCETCGMEFNIKAKLRMHYKKKHMDYEERPHKCSFCEKKFIETSHLREHLRTHTGEKPLQCDVCSRSFAKRSSLREHKKLHSDEKQHRCKICGKEFAQLAGYWNHMKNHP